MRRIGLIHRRRCRLGVSMYPTKKFHDDEQEILFAIPRRNETYLIECGRAFILEDLGSTI